MDYVGTSDLQRQLKALQQLQKSIQPEDSTVIKNDLFISALFRAFPENKQTAFSAIPIILKMSKIASAKYACDVINSQFLLYLETLFSKETQKQILKLEKGNYLIALLFLVITNLIQSPVLWLKILQSTHLIKAVSDFSENEVIFKFQVQCVSGFVLMAESPNAYVKSLANDLLHQFDVKLSEDIQFAIVNAATSYFQIDNPDNFQLVLEKLLTAFDASLQTGVESRLQSAVFAFLCEKSLHSPESFQDPAVQNRICNYLNQESVANNFAFVVTNLCQIKQNCAFVGKHSTVQKYLVNIQNKNSAQKSFTLVENLLYYKEIKIIDSMVTNSLCQLVKEDLVKNGFSNGLKTLKNLAQNSLNAAGWIREFDWGKMAKNKELLEILNE